MAKLVLISGLIPYDAGKTWFTIGSALAARSVGLRTGVFKPVAAHSIWYSPVTLKKSLELGLLVGNDILAYYRRGLVGEVAISNPIAMATAPPDLTSYSDVESYMRDLEELTSTAILSRFTDCNSNVVKHYVHPENLNRVAPRMRDIIERIHRGLRAEAIPFREALKYLTSLRVEEDLNACLDRISRGSDVVFIESFNDAIAPYTGLLRRVDIIAITTPGRVLIYTRTGEISALALEYMKQKAWDGLRSRNFVNRVKADTTLEVDLASRPRPQRAHLSFVEFIAGKK